MREGANLIQVENLKKVYGEFEALRGISFEIERGEVVGFLGPNGAGKTTTMRILTGFIPATSGKAVVAGYDVFDDSLEVRKRLGYLPENVPLYTEMRVEEYLRFRAALKKVPMFERSAAVDRALEQCRLKDSRKRIIGHLSKGFRQRVGLADALLGSPQVLVLDEPTVGLDPNQVRETRNLIKSLAENHTVILSTHILHEVEMICNRVIIIHEGRIVADDTQKGLIESMSDSRRLIVELIGDRRIIEDTVNSIEGIDKLYCVNVNGTVKLEIDLHPGFDLRERLSREFATRGIVILEMRSERMMLEDIFSNLTSDKFVEPKLAPIPDAPSVEPDAQIPESIDDNPENSVEPDVSDDGHKVANIDDFVTKMKEAKPEAGAFPEERTEDREGGV